MWCRRRGGGTDGGCKVDCFLLLQAKHVVCTSPGQPVQEVWFIEAAFDLGFLLSDFQMSGHCCDPQQPLLLGGVRCLLICPDSAVLLALLLAEEAKYMCFARLTSGNDVVVKQSERLPANSTGSSAEHAPLHLSPGVTAAAHTLSTAQSIPMQLSSWA